jgi:hypothetical protein
MKPTPFWARALMTTGVLWLALTGLCVFGGLAFGGVYDRNFALPVGGVSAVIGGVIYLIGRAIKDE